MKDSREPSTSGSAMVTSTTLEKLGSADNAVHDDLIDGDVLVEDVSIDGMCGVY